MSSYYFDTLILLIENYLYAQGERTEFYEHPQRRTTVMTYQEDTETYYERRTIDSNYHETYDKLKKHLSIHGIKIDNFGFPRTFYENYLQQEVRMAESRCVKKLLFFLGLDEFIPEWSQAISLSAQYRLADRRVFATKKLWIKSYGKEHNENRRYFINKKKEEARIQRKTVFQKLRHAIRTFSSTEHKEFYKLIPLNGLKSISISDCDILVQNIIR